MSGPSTRPGEVYQGTLPGGHRVRLLPVASTDGGIEVAVTQADLDAAEAAPPGEREASPDTASRALVDVLQRSHPGGHPHVVILRLDHMGLAAAGELAIGWSSAADPDTLADVRVVPADLMAWLRRGAAGEDLAPIRSALGGAYRLEMGPPRTAPA